MSCEYREEEADASVESVEEYELLLVLGAGFFGPASLALMNDGRPLCRIALEDGLEDPFCDNPEETAETCDFLKLTSLDD